MRATEYGKGKGTKIQMTSAKFSITPSPFCKKKNSCNLLTIGHILSDPQTKPPTPSRTDRNQRFCEHVWRSVVSNQTHNKIAGGNKQGKSARAGIRERRNLVIRLLNVANASVSAEKSINKWSSSNRQKTSHRESPKVRFFAVSTIQLRFSMDRHRRQSLLTCPSDASECISIPFPISPISPNLRLHFTYSSARRG